MREKERYRQRQRVREIKKRGIVKDRKEIWEKERRREGE